MIKLAHLQYQLNDTQTLDTLLEKTEQFWFQHSSDEQYQRCYYDSFDWRLYQKKYCLYTENNGKQTRLHLLDELNKFQRSIILPDKTSPLLMTDFPNRWQTDLIPILSVRAVLEKIHLNVRIQQYRCLNADEKTILRVYVGYYHLADKPETETLLPISLTIVPIRGYPKPYQLMQQRIEALALKPETSKRLLKRSLKLNGQKANDYSSKLRLKLSPDLSTINASLLILTHLKQSIARNTIGTCADIDSEFLHDFRVAGRRSRALLSQIKTAFAAEKVQFLKTELAWLSQITSPTRDADVYLLKFEAYRQYLPETMQTHLDPFKAFLTQHQLICQNILKNELESQRYQDLMLNWQAFLDKNSDELNIGAIDPDAPILTTASKRIYTAECRLLKAGQQIDDDSPAEALHDLRKLAKKLRYLLEFFQSLYDKTEIKALIKNLKILQDNLGDFQDLAVQAQQIQQFADQMHKQYHAKTHTLMAMGALSATLLNGLTEERTEFAECFQIFAEDNLQYQSLFNNKGDNE